MKRTIIIITLVLYSIAANAQTYHLFPRDRNLTAELMRIIAFIIVIYIVTSFILSLTRMILNNQLKHKMLEKGVPGEVVTQMLPRKNELIAPLKWFCVLMAIALGLLIISFFPPGIHSIITMTACVALGFLGFYLWAKRLNNN